MKEEVIKRLEAYLLAFSGTEQGSKALLALEKVRLMSDEAVEERCCFDVRLLNSELITFNEHLKAVDTFTSNYAGSSMISRTDFAVDTIEIWAHMPGLSIEAKETLERSQGILDALRERMLSTMMAEKYVEVLTCASQEPKTTSLSDARENPLQMN